MTSHAIWCLISFILALSLLFFWSFYISHCDDLHVCFYLDPFLASLCCLNHLSRRYFWHFWCFHSSGIIALGNCWLIFSDFLTDLMIVANCDWLDWWNCCWLMTECNYVYISSCNFWTSEFLHVGSDNVVQTLFTRYFQDEFKLALSLLLVLIYFTHFGPRDGLDNIWTTITTRRYFCCCFLANMWAIRYMVILTTQWIYANNCVHGLR